jgi:hypothetical protein
MKLNNRVDDGQQSFHGVLVRRSNPSPSSHDTNSGVDPGEHPDLAISVLWQVQVSHYVEKVR